MKKYQNKSPDIGQGRGVSGQDYISLPQMVFPGFLKLF